MSPRNWYAEQNSVNCERWVRDLLEFLPGIQLFFKGAQRFAGGHMPIVNIGHSLSGSVRFVYPFQCLKKPFNASILVHPVSRLMSDFPRKDEIPKRAVDDLIKARVVTIHKYDMSSTLIDLHNQLLAFSVRPDLAELSAKREAHKKKMRDKANKRRFKDREDPAIRAASLFMLAFDLDYNPEFARQILKMGVSRLDNIVQFLIKNRTTITYLDDDRFDQALKQCQVHRVLNT